MTAQTRGRFILLAISLSPVLNAHSVDFLTRQLPWAVVGVPYDEKIEISIDGRCPRGDVGLDVFGGALPHGIEIVGERLVGTPRSTGTYPVMIRASNSCAFEVKGFQFIVTDEPVLRPSLPELQFVYRDGYAKPMAQSVLVTSTWPSVPYSVDELDPKNSAWLSFSHRGMTPERDSDMLADVLAVRVNVEGLKPGVYRSTLKLSTPAFPTVSTMQVTLTILP